MSLRDVLEYRLSDDTLIVFSLEDVPAHDGAGRCLYARPFGAQEWGYYSGPFYFDAAYKASHAVGATS